MKKKTILNLADTIFWYFVYMLPVIVYLINIIPNGAVSFDTLLSSTGFDIINTNVVTSTFNSLFATGGILPLFAVDSPLIIIISWFIFAVILHLMADFILFIPRLAHKWLGKFTKECE